MATTLEVIRRVTVEAKERGITELDAKLQKLEKQYQDVSAAGAQTAKSTESAERAFARHSRAVDENLRAMDRFTSQAKAFADARAQGRIGEQEHLRLLTLSEQQMRKTTGANDNFAKSTTQMANSTGLARHEMVNFSRQVQDVGVSLASGQSPMMVLIQQGTQIADVFATSGASLRGFLGQVGSFALRFGPAAAAIGVVATALYALNKAFDEALESRQALGGGRGRTLTGVTPQDIDQLAEGAPSGMTRNEARQGAIGGIRAGAPSLEVLKQARDLTKQYAATLDLELKPAQEEINALIGDRTSASYERVSQKLGAFNLAVANNMRNLQSQGRFAEAAKAGLDAITPALVKNTDATTAWERAWKGALSAAQEFLAIDVTKIKIPEVPGTATGQRQNEVTRDYINRRRGTPAADVTEPIGGTMLQADPAALKAVRQREIELNNIAIAAAKANEVETARLRTLEATGPAEQAAAAAALSRAQAIGTQTQETKVNADAELARRTVLEEAAISERKLDAAMGARIQTMFAITQAQKEAAAAATARAAAMGTSADPNAAAERAALEVRMQARAEAEKDIFVQQRRLAMGPALIAAASAQGEAGIRLNAQLQKQLELQTAGIDISTKDSQARIANAGAMATQANSARDVAQATEIRASGQDQVELIRLETSLIDANSVERDRRLAIMRGEIQARALERQGLTDSADATRASTRAIADANAVLQRNAEARQRAAEAARQYAQALGEAIEAAKTEKLGSGFTPEALTNFYFNYGGIVSKSLTSRQFKEGETFSVGGAGSPMGGTAFQNVGNANIRQRYINSLAGGMPPETHVATSEEVRKSMAEQQKIRQAETEASSYSLGAGQSMTPGGYTIMMQLGLRAGEAARSKLDQERLEARNRLEDIQRQALEQSISIAERALSKQIQFLREADEISQDATSRVRDLEQKVEQAEQRRQQVMQAYLAAGPSPTEPNADLFYDPQKRLLFAEQIAGNTSDLLKQQIEQAKAEAAAARSNSDAIETQIAAIEDQQEQLQEQSELLAAGVDLSMAEVDGITKLISVVRDELPQKLAAQFDRVQAVNVSQTTEKIADALMTSPSKTLQPNTLNTFSALANISSRATNPNPIMSYNPIQFGMGKTYLGSFQHGGEFTVPGSGMTDSPFRINLTPGEHVAVTPPGRTPSKTGTNIERMIVQLPPAVDPIVYMKKASRPSMARGMRNLGRRV